MKRERTTTYIECDGCGYTIDGGNLAVATLRIPWLRNGGDRGHLEFHFHAPQPDLTACRDGSRSDCLRYFVRNNSIVAGALRARGLPDSEIDAFLAQVSHRTEGAPA